MPDAPAAPAPTGSEATDPRSDLTRSLHRSSGSFELVLAPVLMALIGLWIDHTMGTTPMFTVGFAVFGAIGAGVAQYYAYRHRVQLLAEAGELPVDRPARQYHARNRSDGDLGRARAGQGVLHQVSTGSDS